MAVHRSNLLLKPVRGGRRAQSTGGVDNDRGSCHYRATNTLDKGRRLLGSNSNGVGFARFSQIVDADIVTAGSEIVSGRSTNSDIVHAVVVEKSVIAKGRVVCAGGVVRESKNTSGRVEVANGIVKKRLITGSGVANAGGVVMECCHTSGRVVVAGNVALQHRASGGCVVVAGGIFKKRLKTVSGVVSAEGVIRES